MADVTIILQEKIAVFLMKNRGRPFCDDCISSELSTPTEDVQRETEKMRTWAGFVPANNACFRCGLHKVAIRAPV